MFGGKEGKKLSQDDASKYYQAITNLVEVKDTWNANMEEMQLSRNQMCSDILQVKNNTRENLKLAKVNIDSHQKIIKKMEDFVGEVKYERTRINELVEAMKDQGYSCEKVAKYSVDYKNISDDLVSKNKDVVEDNEICLGELENMNKVGKEMELQTLNLAISARRKGAMGQEFLDNAEKVRQLSLKYVDSANQVKSMLDGVNKKLDEIQKLITKAENQVEESGDKAKEVALNNVYATQRLGNIKLNEIVDYLTEIKEMIGENKKNDEEIVKTQERSLIQIEDINFEVIYQKNSSNELFDVVKPFFNAEYDSYEED